MSMAEQRPDMPMPEELTNPVSSPLDRRVDRRTGLKLAAGAIAAFVNSRNAGATGETTGSTESAGIPQEPFRSTFYPVEFIIPEGWSHTTTELEDGKDTDMLFGDMHHGFVTKVTLQAQEANDFNTIEDYKVTMVNEIMTKEAPTGTPRASSYKVCGNDAWEILSHFKAGDGPDSTYFRLDTIFLADNKLWNIQMQIADNIEVYKDEYGRFRELLDSFTLRQEQA